MLFHGLLRFFRGGGMRPVVVVVLLAALFVAFPDRNFSLGGADAASSSPACASGVGVGGTNNGTAASTAGGNGCVVIKYVDAGVVTYETFNYTGVDQTWTVPSGVTSVIFYLLGAGGGGVPMAGGYGDGGGGGYATGTYTVSSGQVLTVIVGQGGGGAGNLDSSVAALQGERMGSGTGGRYGRGSAGVTQGRTITNRDRCGCGRGAKLVVIAELKLPSIHEHGSCEGLGAGENKDPVTCLDEIGHGGGGGSVVSNIGVHGDRARGILMENQVPGRSSVSLPEDAAARRVDVPCRRPVDEDRPRRGGGAVAQDHAQRGCAQIQRLRARRR